MRLTGRCVSIVSIDEIDTKELWSLIYGESDPAWKKWDAPYFPLEFVDYPDYISHLKERFERDGDVQSLAAIVTTDGELIGTVSYYWEHRPSWWLEMGIVIYQPAFWNGGFGTEALTLWGSHLFASMPLVRIGLTTWSGNQRMIRCAEKLGMQMEARIRKVRLYNGVFYDSIRMGILREEWEQIHGLRATPLQDSLLRQ